MDALRRVIVGEETVDALLARRRGRRAEEATTEQPKIAVAFTREDLIGQGASGTNLAVAFQRAFNGKLSGDVVYALTPYSIAGKSR